MKYTRIFLLALPVLLLGCNKDRETATGLKIKVLKEGSGAFARPGEFLVTRMIVKSPQDSVLRDTDEQKVPMIIPVGDGSNPSLDKGINSAFRMMKLNDSVSINIDVKTLFGDEPIPPQLKPEDKLTYIFTVRDIADQSGVNRIQRELQQQQVMEQQRMVAAQLTTDTVALDAYLSERKITAQKDKSGLRYVIRRMGRGPTPTVNSTIRVTYKGTLMDGKVFDQSKGPVEWPLNQMIKGWQIGFGFLQKGTAATLYVPSTLGYGQNGYYPDIPPNANLIFEVELLDVKN